MRSFKWVKLSASVFILIWLAFFFLNGPGEMVLPADQLQRGFIPAYEDFEKTLEKTSVRFEILPETDVPEESLQLSGQHAVNVSLSAHELSALLRFDPWEYNFLHESQIWLGDDGNFTLSGRLYGNRLYGFARAHGPTPESELDWLKLWQEVNFFRPIFHLQGQLSVTKRQIFFRLQNLRINRYLVPAVWLNKHQDKITSIVQAHLLHHPETLVDKLEINNGQLWYEGTLPDVIAVTTDKADN